MSDQDWSPNPNFLESIGILAIIAIVLTIATLAVVHIVGGDHASTEIYPVCRHGRISIRAVVSDGFSDDRTVQLFIDGTRVARAKINADDWERLATAMREPYAGGAVTGLSAVSAPTPDPTGAPGFDSPPESSPVVPSGSTSPSATRRSRSIQKTASGDWLVNLIERKLKGEL